jgi:hypothetical protein
MWSKVSQELKLRGVGVHPHGRRMANVDQEHVQVGRKPAGVPREALVAGLVFNEIRRVSVMIDGLALFCTKLW